MKIFAIGDLHLSFKEKIMSGKWNKIQTYKPMHKFGEKWNQHYKKIFNNWLEIVNKEDIVLLPGDLSWAMKLEQIQFDLEYLSLLTGRKVLIKGNHDYWWNSISQVRSNLPESTFALQYDSINFHNITIAGTRGWLTPGAEEFDEHDQKVYRREVNRLEMSLKSIEKRGEELIVMFHYMPVNEEHKKNEFIELLKKYEVDYCVYGHLHGKESHQNRLPSSKWGIEFRLVSADFINFKPELILSK